MILKALGSKIFNRHKGRQAGQNIDDFWIDLPKNAGGITLMAAAVAWGCAMLVGFYTATKTQEMIEFREKLRDTQALKPLVPLIKSSVVPKEEVENFVSKVKGSYKDLDMTVDGSTIIITAKSTRHFTAFREAVGHVQNNGAGWRVFLDKLCVGTECDEQYKLAALLKMSNVSVEKVKE